MSVLEKVARAIDPSAWDITKRFVVGDPKLVMRSLQFGAYGRADDAITTFLEAAAEQGWHMRPDEATEEMARAARHTPIGVDCLGPYHAMLAAAPEFKWKDDS